VVSNGVLTRVHRFVSSLGRAFGIAGIVVLVVMMLTTGADVFLRYAFNSPILGSCELIELMMLVVAFTTIVWCTVDESHIKVDLLSKFIPHTSQTISDIVFYLISLVLMSLIGWRSFLEALAIRPTDISAGEMTWILDIPHYPFYIFITLACVLTALMLLVHIGQGIAKVVKKWN